MDSELEDDKEEVREFLHHAIMGSKAATSREKRRREEDLKMARLLEESENPRLPSAVRELESRFEALDLVLFLRPTGVHSFESVSSLVERHCRYPLHVKHLAQIKYLYADAFEFRLRQSLNTMLEKREVRLLIFPSGVTQPGKAGLSSFARTNVLDVRRGTMHRHCVDYVAGFHRLFLAKRLHVDPARVSGDWDEDSDWHPDFDVESVPEVPLAFVPGAKSAPASPIKKTRSRLRDDTDASSTGLSKKQRLSESSSTQGNTEIDSPTKVEEEGEAEGRVVDARLAYVDPAIRARARAAERDDRAALLPDGSSREERRSLYRGIPKLCDQLIALYTVERRNVMPFETIASRMEGGGGITAADEAVQRDICERRLRILHELAPEWLRLTQVGESYFVRLELVDIDLSQVCRRVVSSIRDELRRIDDEEKRAQ